MNPTQNSAAPEKGASPSCRPLVDTLSKLGSTWAAHGLRIGRDAVRMSAETLDKAVQTLDTLAAAFEQKAARRADSAAPSPEEAPAPPEAPAPAAEPGPAPAA